MAKLEIETQNTEGMDRIALRGELDISTATELESRLEPLINGDGGDVVLDLRELEFIDSSGVRVLVLAARRFDAAGRHLALVRGPEEVDRVLRLTGVDERIEVRDAPANS